MISTCRESQLLSSRPALLTTSLQALGKGVSCLIKQLLIITTTNSFFFQNFSIQLFCSLFILLRFGIFLGISFSEDADTTSLLLHGPIEVNRLDPKITRSKNGSNIFLQLALGIGFGLGWGLIAMWLPAASSPSVGFFRLCCWLALIQTGPLQTGATVRRKTHQLISWPKISPCW